MPGKIKVKVLAGRNLPVMDRASDTTDAFVEIKFGGVTHKTDVCRKSLNPHWSSTEWYRFEVLFDTMHGIRGELNVIVKVELFSDFNKYKTSSCGVQFFHWYKATSIHGFVEELVVNDDPEYQWIDKIRTPRASNEARQVAFIKLSNQCLDILATDDESVTDLSQYYKNHQEELQKMINILNPKGLSMFDSQENPDDDDEKIELVRQASLNSYAGSVSLYQDNYVSRNSLRHLSEDQTDLNRLLSRKDDDDSDSSGPIEKIKKLKTNFFTKRFTKRKGDKKTDEKPDDSISLKSNSSDTSRISLFDIKNELKKFKRLKKPKFQKVLNKEDEGEGMASILARSVIHARTTLACIAETQDSQAESSPCSTMRRTDEFESNNITDEGKPRKISAEQEKVETVENKIPEIQFSSLKNISSEDLPSHEPRVRRISESCPTSPMAGRSDNLLKLPGDVGYFGSVSSALSGESSIYTSSEDDYESSDLKTDTDDALETTSSIVKSVLRHEADPAFLAQMDRKLAILQNSPPQISESIIADFDKKATMEVALDKIESDITLEKEAREFECKIEKAEENNETIEPSIAANEPSTSTRDEKCVPKPNSHYIKIHNPFAHRKASTSISCPSSPVEKHNLVYRSSKRIKDKLSKISKSNMIKSISHISLFPKTKKEPKTLSQPGSSSDVPSFPSKYPSETVLGSHFLSYSDLLGLDQDRIQANKLCKSDEIGRSKFSMYIGSEPESRCSISGPSHPLIIDEHDHKKEKLSLKPTGLIHTAMETMLIDKVQSLLIPTSPEIAVNTKFFDDVSEKLEEHKNSGATIRQLQNTTGSTTPRIVAVTPKRLSDDLTAKVDKIIERKHQEEYIRLIHTPKEILLMDKAQAILPDTESKHNTDSLHEDFNSDMGRAMHTKKDSRGSISTLMDKVHFHPHFFHHKKDDSSHDVRSGGLIHTAMQTMLIDRAQSMIPNTPEPIPIHTEPHFGEIGKYQKPHDQTKKRDHEKESTGLVHSALQTMLIDNIQSVLPGSDEPIPIRTETDFSAEPHKNHGHVKDKESTGLVHSALHTMLIDNIQSVLPDSDQPIPIKTETIFDGSISEEGHGKDKESTGFVHSALQTMLIDNIQSVLPDSNEPIPIRTEPNFGEEPDKSDGHANDKESTGLVHSALQTMLIDNVQSVLPDSDEPILISTESIFDDSISQESHEKNKDSTGLVHSALQTMLIDNVQSVLPDSDEPIPIRTEPDVGIKSHNNHGHAKDTESTGLVHSALQTMLIDNVNSALPDFSALIPINLNYDTEKEKSKYDVIKHTGLVSSTMENMLLGKSQINPNDMNVESVSERKDFNRESLESEKEVSKGLVHTAMEAMLIDRMQTIFPKATEADTKATHVDKIQDSDIELKSTSLVQNAMQTIFMDKVQSSAKPDNLPLKKSLPSDTKDDASKTNELNSTKALATSESNATKAKESPLKSERGSPIVKELTDSKSDISESKKEIKDPSDKKSKQKKGTDEDKEISKQRKALKERKKHFCRQDSIHSVTSTKSSSEETSNTHNVTRALEHFHPILSGGLETIPSVECSDSFERTIDETNISICDTQTLLSEVATIPSVEGRVERSNETNSASVCDNSHAACRFDREREKDRDRSEKGSPRHARHESYGGREPVGSEKASEKEKDALEMQKALWDTVLPEVEGDEAPVLDLCADKDACVLELDEAEDVETARALAKRRVHMQAYTSALKPASGAQPLAFTQVSRARLVLSSGVAASAAAERQVAKALDGAAYKLRRLSPAALNAAFHLELPEVYLSYTAFHLELPEQHDEIQLVVSGTAIPLADPYKAELSENGHSHTHSHTSHSQTSSQHSHSQNNSQNDSQTGDDDIFELDEEQMKPALTAQEMVEDKSVVNGQ
ncbi:Uncharacterized protein OBRU01_08453, partial [Operophtera brumata]